MEERRETEVMSKEQREETQGAHGVGGEQLVPLQTRGIRDTKDDDGLGSSEDECDDTNESPTVSSTIASNDIGKSESEEPTKSLWNGQRRILCPDAEALQRLLLTIDAESDSSEDEETDTNTGWSRTTTTTTTTTTATSATSSGWQRTMVRDLLDLSSGSSIGRRHSISTCDMVGVNRERVRATASLPVGKTCDQMTKDRHKLNKMADLGSESNVSLALGEVAHIRAVLSRAELEDQVDDEQLKNDLVAGKICFVCRRRRFGFFSRGQTCQICRQLACRSCSAKMRIPVEHFRATPVQALSPLPDVSLTKEESKAKPRLTWSANTWSAGSAPGTPVIGRRRDVILDNINEENNTSINAPLFTISGMVTNELNNSNLSPSSMPPLSLHSFTPTSNTALRRRRSTLTPNHVERERLAGSLLVVCTGCRDMVLQERTTLINNPISY